MAGKNRLASILPLLVGAVIAVAAWIRLTPLTRSTLWAEDGRIFLWDALNSQASPWSTVWEPYAGYLHVVPRLAAQVIATAVPAERYALAMAAAACVLTGVCGALVFVCAREVTAHLWLRMAFAAVTVVVPALPREVLGNLANAHWFGLWLMPWLLIYRPRTRLGAWALGAVAALCALTEIQTAVFLPLLAWRWRDRLRWPARGGLLLGLLLQVAMRSVRDPAAGPIPGADNIASGYLVNALLTLWWGSEHAITSAVRSYGWTVAVVALMPSMAALVVVLLRGTGSQRLLAVSLPAASVVLWCAALLVNGTVMDWSQPDARSDRTFDVLRYAVVPSMFLLAALLLAFAVLERRWRWLGALILLPVLIATVSCFVPDVTTRSTGPAWAPEVADARSECLVDPDVDFVDRPIAPPGWTVRVPCEVLVDDS